MTFLIIIMDINNDKINNLNLINQTNMKLFL